MAFGSTVCLLVTLTTILFIHSAKSLFCPKTNGNRLVHLVIVMRHGFGTSLTTFPADKHLRSILDQFGALEQQKLGEYIGSCYPGNFSYVEVYSLSSDAAVFSSEAFFEGFRIHQPDVETTPIQPIPEKYQIKPVKNVDDIDEIFGEEDEKHRRLLQELSSKAGLNSSSVDLVIDTVLAAEEAELPVVDWIAGNGTLLTFVKEMAELKLEKLIRTSTATPLIDFITEKINNQINDVPAKLTVISADGLLLASVLASLGDFTGSIPPFSSSVVIELTKDAASSLMVSAFYLNRTDVEPYSIFVRKGCGKPCNFYHFVKSLQLSASKTNRPENYFTSLIFVRNFAPNYLTIGLAGFTVFLGVLAILIRSVFALKRYRQRKLLSKLNSAFRSNRKYQMMWKGISPELLDDSDDDDDDDDDSNKNPLCAKTLVGEATRMPLI